MYLRELSGGLSEIKVTYKEFKVMYVMWPLYSAFSIRLNAFDLKKKSKINFLIFKKNHMYGSLMKANFAATWLIVINMISFTSLCRACYFQSMMNCTS